MVEELKTRRRWFQFSLRTTLFMFSLLGLGCGWLGMQLDQKRQHESVVNEILQSGGKVYVLNGGDIPAWKTWIFGSYAVNPVVWDLENTNATDSLLSQTQGMDLVSLVLRSTTVTDAELTRLKEFTSLKYLFLDNTSITDAGLVHLEALANLEWLVLNNTQITDVGLAHLKGLNNLENLDLSNTLVTDAGLRHLKGLTSLKILYLRNIPITDAGLSHLNGMSSLKYLFLNNTQITDAGVDRLQKAIPGCEIDYSH